MKMSTNNNWLGREIELACKYENPDWDGKSFDYGCYCFTSAEKAFRAASKSLDKDHHSGFSHAMTIGIIKRLLDCLPLTPIEDTDDVWERHEWMRENEFYCTRYHSLFKYVNDDGSVSYTDFDRYYGIEDGEEISWHGKRALDAVNALFPITMPYYPAAGKYEVRFKHDWYIPYMIVEPDGTKHAVWLRDGEYFMSSPL
jgi:hypothetical protein